MKRAAIFTVFIIGLAPVFIATALETFLYDLPRVLWSVLFDTEIPEPARVMSWWLKTCREKAGVR